MTTASNAISISQLNEYIKKIGWYDTWQLAKE